MPEKEGNRLLFPMRLSHTHIGIPARLRCCVRSLVTDGSGAGSHVGGEDVVGVAVEVLAGSVVSHGGAWIGVPGGDLDVA